MGFLGNLWSGVRMWSGVVKKAWDTVTDWFSSDAGESEAVDENSPALSIEKTHLLLRSYSEKIGETAEEIEDKCTKYVEDYFDELTKLVEQGKSEPVKKGIGMKRLLGTKRNIRRKIRGSITGAVSKKMSFDDAECLRIIAMKPGTEKEEGMRFFCNKIIKEANEELANNIEEALEEQFDEINQFLESYAEEKELALQNMIQDLSEMEKHDIQDENDKERLKLLPQIKLDMIDKILSVSGGH